MRARGIPVPWNSVVGYTTLTGCVVLLYLFAAWEAFRGAGVSPAVVPLGLWMAGLLITARKELREQFLNNGKVRRFSIRQDGAAFTAVVAGALVTFIASVDLGMGPVVASGLAGVAVALVAPAVAVPFFCGSFVGMASPHLLGHGGVLLAGVIAGAVYLAGVGVYTGIGGKLGTVALLGCIGAAGALRVPFLPGALPSPEYLPRLLAVLVPWSVLGAWGTFMVHARLLRQFSAGPVVASGAVGMVAGVVLPLLHGEITGGLAALAVFSASFAGMSNRRRCPHAWEMVPAGVLCALVLVYAAPWFGGAGGKLGAAAFGAVMGTRGLAALVRLLTGAAPPPLSE